MHEVAFYLTHMEEQQALLRNMECIKLNTLKINIYLSRTIRQSWIRDQLDVL